ncbi:hypothetical protein LOD99_12647 [Oopsacas minuta]|uniref:DUF1152 domain-containing protein n=1 Tax=Oopsacas minuta TaxID=111878 RepID=A0AAV7JD52_9METZ|nr:hypothetical protein LOD99_12647 [Oopsacas minuta]
MATEVLPNIMLIKQSVRLYRISRYTMGNYFNSNTNTTRPEPIQTNTPPQEPIKPQASSFSMREPLLFSLLANYDRILLAGCGGGYDFMSGLPLYFALKELGKKPFLANLSFTTLNDVKRLNPDDVILNCGFRVHYKTKVASNRYFPELFTCQWFRKKGEDVEIFAFDHFPATRDLIDCYQWICKERGIDAIVLVDGGTDSLTYGDECGMGTPVEDHTSMAAIDMVDGIGLKLLCCIGFGVDSFHGISHGLFLQNVARAEKQGHFYGSFSVSRHTPEARQYIECYEYVAARMQPSIVCSSIISGINGEFGNHHSTERTKSSTLFINHLMCILWTFDLQGVNKNIPYLDKVKQSTGALETDSIITSYRSKIGDDKIRQPLPLPM